MTGKQVKKIAISASVGSGIGILIAALFIFAMAAVLAIGDIPAMLISPATVVILAFGGFCGGFCSAGFSHEKGLFCGAFSGIIFFGIIWIFGGLSGTGAFGIGAAIKAAMIFISSSLGGIIGVNYIKRK
ncbi:MAG: TIGR04086 family membrane protein [Oscillospiraceae bacterium]|nr:TIGR04086 family membrane protein [Oscillospiraceae bacterium]